MSSPSFDLPQSAVQRLLSALGRRMLPSDIKGQLDVTLPTGRVLRIGGQVAGPVASLRLNAWRVLASAAARGAIGFGESYIDGGWDSPNPVALMRFYLQNRQRLDAAAPPGLLRNIMALIRHRLRRHDRNGARRNVEAHYDLGNGFYRLWLDAGMSYSSALFLAGTDTLEMAQAAKNRRVIDALDVSPGQRVLEIGCGWGGLMADLARHGAQVTGLTLSPAQHAFACERLAAAGLAAQCEARLEDYRDATGQFDRIVSIEMIEAVGEAYWPAYLRVVADRLAPSGVAVIQSIIIAPQRFAAYRCGVDFIQRHIFPGGMLPTEPIICSNAAEAGFSITPIERFGASYARTLNIWRQRFEAAWPQIEALGFDAKFRRKWRCYLSYCEAGFAEGAIDVGLYRLARSAS